MAKSTESAKKCAISRKSFNDKAQPIFRLALAR